MSRLPMRFPAAGRLGPVRYLAAALLTLFVPAVAYLRFRAPAAPQEPIRVTRASAQQTPPVEPMPAPMPVPVFIDADATQTAPADPAALEALVVSLATISGTRPPDLAAAQAAPETVANTGPDWYGWGRLAAARAVATPSADTVGVYGVHASEGTTVCLINRAGQKVETRLRVRLPHGVYKIERLTFSPPMVVAARENRIAMRLAGLPDDPRPTVPARLEWLEGADLTGAGTITKLYTLEPGQICLYRYTDEARAARAALESVQGCLHEMATRTAGPAHRLRRMLDEGAPYWNSLNADGGHQHSQESRLRSIHHLLLVTAQAHSLQHNYLERKTVPAVAGGAVMAALDRFTAALAETSAALLGLVPEITVSVDAMPAAAPPTGGTSAERGTDASVASEPRRLTVTVALANAGARSVGMVKVGLDLSALPAGIACDPDDPAFFGTLSPGQTVRATFHLRGAAGSVLKDNQCIGDISYFAATAPAHLRPHPW